MAAAPTPPSGGSSGGSWFYDFIGKIGKLLSPGGEHAVSASSSTPTENKVGAVAGEVLTAAPDFKDDLADRDPEFRQNLEKLKLTITSVKNSKIGSESLRHDLERCVLKGKEYINSTVKHMKNWGELEYVLGILKNGHGELAVTIASVEDKIKMRNYGRALELMENVLNGKEEV